METCAPKAGVGLMEGAVGVETRATTGAGMTIGLGEIGATGCTGAIGVTGWTGAGSGFGFSENR